MSDPNEDIRIYHFLDFHDSLTVAADNQNRIIFGAGNTESPTIQFQPPSELTDFIQPDVVFKVLYLEGHMQHGNPLLQGERAEQHTMINAVPIARPAYEAFLQRYNAFLEQTAALYDGVDQIQRAVGRVSPSEIDIPGIAMLLEEQLAQAKSISPCPTLDELLVSQS